MRVEKKRRRTTRLLLFSVPIVIAAGGAGLLLVREPCPTDVILVTVDTLRADRIGAYGYSAAQTPNIDRLAARGTLFRSATTPFPRTTPALASLLTGLWPHHHGSREVGERIQRGTIVAEVFRDRGYRTIALSAALAATPRHRINTGFDVFEVHDRVRAPQLTQRALELADAVPDDVPLFLWVHYFDPHFPYDPPMRETDLEGPCARLLSDLSQRESRLGHIYSNLGGIARDALDDCNRHYDLEVAFTDRALGDLFGGLGSRLTDGITVFTSDHGENLGDDGLFYEHGPSIHEAAIRVPLIIAGPGLAAGRQDGGVARLEDVAPTLLELTDTPVPAGMKMDGMSLAPGLHVGYDGERQMPSFALAESGSALHVTMFNFLVSGRADRQHCINGDRYSRCQQPGAQRAFYDHVADPFINSPVGDTPPEIQRLLDEAAKRWRPEQTRARTVRTNRFKLVEKPQLTGYSKRLYDVLADPNETRDVGDQHPDDLAKLGKVLDEWSRGLRRRGIVVRQKKDEDALRELGYVR